MKNFLDIIDNPIISRSSYTWRYSSSRLTDPENLSTHVYEVEMIGMHLLDELAVFTGDPSYVSEEVIYMFRNKALVHDIDEVELGDTPRPLKYASPDIHKAISVVADTTAHALIDKTYVSQQLRDTLHKAYNSSKSGRTGYILSVADMLCVVKKTRVEVEKLGNKTMLDVVYNQINYTHSLRDKLKKLNASDPDDKFYEFFDKLLSDVESHARDTLIKYNYEDYVR